MNRGSCIYIANHLNASQIKFNSTFTESVWCEIVKGSEKTLIGCIYRSGSSDIENNNSLLELLSEISSMQYNHIAVCGDFNLREIDWNNGKVNASSSHFASAFYDKLNDLYLTQHVKEPTRFREGNTPSTLDLLITNSENLVDSLSINPPIGCSDHAVLNFNIDIETQHTNETLGYAYYRGNYHAMRSDLEEVNWEEQLKDKNVHRAWDRFNSIVTGLIERHIPLRRHTIRKNPCYNRDIDRARKEKNQAWKSKV